MKILQIPPGGRVDASQASDLRHLSEVLLDSAQLLEEARTSADDPAFREAAVDLAIRSLRTAAAVMGKHTPNRPALQPSARILSGPWSQSISS